MREKDIKITPSIVDRLIDLEPEYTSEISKSSSQDLKELKQSVRRDIEWLLNSRHPFKDLPEGLVELRSSLALYGIPDFTGKSSKDPNNRNRLLQDIEDAVRIFEPRLVDVKVIFEETDMVKRGVSFKIEALLRVEPTPEPVVFDTVLTVGTSQFEVEDKS
ncbi:MAG: type VI secretion system baseplate subunit TssE [Pyrinomonadaceae bacterium]